jgi:hypothetical protein
VGSYQDAARSVMQDYRKVRDFGTSDARLTEKGWQMLLICGTHRDADTVAESNHRTLVKMLSEVDPDEEHHGVMHCGHWAVGWYDHVLVDPNCDAVMRVVGESAAALADYPILSDDDHSALEMEQHDAGECGEGCSLCECDDQEVC